MRQEKIRCNVRERKRVKEHSMKRVEGGGGEMATTRGLFFCHPKRRALCCVVQLCLVLNLLKRISLLVTP